MVALRRLAGDAALRNGLAAAAHAWIRAAASPRTAAAAWAAILSEAAATPPSSYPTTAAADGTEAAKAVLQEFGVESDLF